MNCRDSILSVAVGVVLGLVSAAQVDAKDVPLGRRYIDPLHGLSLRPPTDTERRREPSPSQIVSWLHRDPQTRVVNWTLSVLQAKERKVIDDLKAYSEALAGKLRQERKFNSDSVKLTSVNGRAAIDLTGDTGGMIRMWKRQVWIRGFPVREPLEPGGPPVLSDRFLILVISGPVDMKNRLHEICQAVLETVRLTDPEAALEARKAGLKRGEDLLAGLTKDALAKAIYTSPRWVLLTFKGQHVGFMQITESATTWQGDEGFQIRASELLRLPGDQQRLVSRLMFVTADRRIERWADRLVVGVGPTALEVAEEGIKQDDLILCHLKRGGRLQALKKMVPAKIYLPRAVGMLLPRLVDLSTPAVYAFASYTTEANDFDMRTFTVVGPEQVTVGTEQVDAIRLTDQPAADQEAITWWVDRKGLLVRMASPEGLAMEATTASQVLKQFPDAEKIVRSMVPPPQLGPAGRSGTK